MHNRFTLKEFRIIRHSRVLACAEVAYAGLVLRGLKLERVHGRLRLGTPGRKVGDRWQVVVEIQDHQLKEQLVDFLYDCHQRAMAA